MDGEKCGRAWLQRNTQNLMWTAWEFPTNEFPRCAWGCSGGGSTAVCVSAVSKITVFRKKPGGTYETGTLNL